MSNKDQRIFHIGPISQTSPPGNGLLLRSRKKENCTDDNNLKFTFRFENPNQTFRRLPIYSCFDLEFGQGRRSKCSRMTRCAVEGGCPSDFVAISISALCMILYFFFFFFWWVSLSLIKFFSLNVFVLTWSFSLHWVAFCDREGHGYGEKNLFFFFFPFNNFENLIVWFELKRR